MLTKLIFLLLVVLLPTLCLGALRVVTTTEDLAAITKIIGGDQVDVSAIAKGTQDPHFIEAKPSFLVVLSKADLVVAIGLSLEQGWLPLLQRGARNPKILPGGSGFLDASSGVQPLEVLVSADRSEGDVHPEGNPHYMADPERGLKVAEKIASKLAELDASHATLFQENFKKFQTSLQTKIKGWKIRLGKYKGTKLFGYHKSFNYFFKYFEFEPVGYLEPKPGIPPTAQHILKLIDISKVQKVKLIVMEDYFDSKAGRSLSEKIGVPLVSIPAYTGGSEGAKTYTGWLELLVTEFESHLGK